jgi:hypothetical protein
MFDKMRNLPKVLKCFIFGRKDDIMLEDLLNEKALHYCYSARLETPYEDRFKSAWTKLYGKGCDNVQEQFVYNCEGGGHSLHVQSRFRELLPKIVGEYLTVLEVGLAEENPKL